MQRRPRTRPKPARAPLDALPAASRPAATKPPKMMKVVAAVAAVAGVAALHLNANVLKSPAELAELGISPVPSINVTQVRPRGRGGTEAALTRTGRAHGRGLGPSTRAPTLHRAAATSQARLPLHPTAACSTWAAGTRCTTTPSSRTRSSTTPTATRPTVRCGCTASSGGGTSGLVPCLAAPLTRLPFPHHQRARPVADALNPNGTISVHNRDRIGSVTGAESGICEWWSW